MRLHQIRPILLIIGFLIMGVAVGIMVSQTFSKGVPPVVTPDRIPNTGPFKLSSPVFDSNGVIPNNYTCYGSGATPPLAIENPPRDTKNFALIMYDQDTAAGDFTHLVVWNIPPDTIAIGENSIPENAVVGTNQANKLAFETICPPAGSGKHRYTYDLYALNEKLTLGATTTKEGLIAAMNGRVISKTQVIGTVTAPQ